jgi:hypothetical protein
MEPPRHAEVEIRRIRKLAASTTVRTPEARRQGPVQPKNPASGHLRRNSSTTSEA